MTVIVTGRDLGSADVVRVARQDEPVELEGAAADRMATSRRVVERTLEGGAAAYGLTTGVGVQKRVLVRAEDAAEFNRRIIETHRVGQGPEAPRDVGRATLVCLLNTLATGGAGVRPDLADLLVRSLNEGAAPRISTLGSIGESDLTTMADVAAFLGEGFALRAGEGLALLNNNSFTMALAALAIHDARSLSRAMEGAAALALEAFAARPSNLLADVAGSLGDPFAERVAAGLRELLVGSFILEPEGPRNLQDPITFRSMPAVLGALRRSLAFADEQLFTGLNAPQGNPIVVAGEGALVSGVSNFETISLSLGLDLARLALAVALTCSQERTLKLLDRAWSGLPGGLVDPQRVGDNGLGIVGIVVQALTAESRLLALPVSTEVSTSTQAEGIEDRMTMAPLAARRLLEMISLGRRIVAMELVIGAQAVELRAARPLGRGTGGLLGAIRDRIPFVRSGDPIPSDFEPVVELIRTAALVPGASPGGSPPEDAQ